MMNIYAEYCRDGDGDGAAAGAKAGGKAVARMLTIYIEEAHAADEVVYNNIHTTTQPLILSSS